MRGLITRNQLSILAILIALLAGVILGSQLLGGRGATAAAPKNNSVEAGFARDMIAHHSQAVAMAFAVRQNTTSDDVRTLSYDIINTQSVQKGMMSGWLDLWGLPQTSNAKPMGWIPAGTLKKVQKQSPVDMNIDNMGTAGNMDGAMMPGMATDADIQKLQAGSGQDADILFLQMMIRHHQGGVQMGLAALDLSDNRPVRTLAQTIVNGQKAEIDAMRQMLKDRGVSP